MFIDIYPASQKNLLGITGEYHWDTEGDPPSFLWKLAYLGRAVDKAED